MLSQIDPDSQSCNLERATIEEQPDGTKKCVCASDYTNPPKCMGQAWYKLAATIGGAIAAAVCIS